MKTASFGVFEQSGFFFVCRDTMLKVVSPIYYFSVMQGTKSAGVLVHQYQVSQEVGGQDGFYVCHLKMYLILEDLRSR
jgi:hypothetical protein